MKCSLLSPGLLGKTSSNRQDIICNTQTAPSSVRGDFTSSWAAGNGQFHFTGGRYFGHLTETERTVWGVSVSRGRVERLPRWACSVPPSRPLIGRSHGWGKEILPIGNNWCFVAGPSCPDTKLTFIGNKISPQVWEGLKAKAIFAAVRLFFFSWIKRQTVR